MVERRPARPVTPRDAVFDQVLHLQRKIADVVHERLIAGVRAAIRVEQPPVAQPPRTMAMNEMAVRDVAGERARSSSRTFAPRLASSMANGAPAHRAPTMMTS